MKGDSESEKMAIEAMRYEKLGDAAQAARRWRSLKLKNEKDGERTWMLIAARGAKEQKAKAPKEADERDEREELLQSQLDRADKLAKDGDKQQALSILYEVRLLYGKDAEMARLVGEAKKRIDKLGGS
jgi:hypothetical protein